MLFDIFKRKKKNDTTSVSLKYVYQSILGNVRNVNQDNLYVDGYYLPESHLEDYGKKEISLPFSNNHHSFCIFDGMGGENKGETASWLAAKCFASLDLSFSENDNSFTQFDNIINACQSMNNAIVNFSKENSTGNMGTTLASLIFYDRSFVGFNVGDSRIYRVHNGKLEQLSKDHVFQSNLFGSAGLTQYLGISQEEFLLSPEIFHGKLEKNDIFLLCSDGVTNMIDEVMLESILSSSDNLQISLQMIMDIVEKNGAIDNASCIIVGL